MTNSTKHFRKQSSLSVKRVGIITKRADEPAANFARDLQKSLQRQGLIVEMNVIHHRIDMIIVLGGDGTLLRMAEQAARHSIPVIGINLGHLGFLTELTKQEAEDALENIISGSITVEDRLMLKAAHYRLDDNTTQVLGYSLNDVVINKNAQDRILHLSTYANDVLITTYKADGLIFATPTGSTAYNLSSGGPLVYPGLASILVTPICPFMLSSRPILLPEKMTIITNFDLENHNDEVNILIDGQASTTMRKGDRLIITTAEHPLRLIVPPHRDYFSILRNKLHWGIPNNIESDRR